MERTTVVVYKYNKEWTLEIFKYKSNMYLSHTPDLNGPWQCDLRGRWVHGRTDDACNCGVLIPKLLYFKIRMLNEARRNKLTLGPVV